MCAYLLCSFVCEYGCPHARDALIVSVVRARLANTSISSYNTYTGVRAHTHTLMCLVCAPSSEDYDVQLLLLLRACGCAHGRLPTVQ